MDEKLARIKELVKNITTLDDDSLTELRDLIIEVLDGDTTENADTHLLELLASASDAHSAEVKRREDARTKRSELRASLVPADRRPVARTSTSTALTASGRELRDGPDIADELSTVLRQSISRPSQGRTIVASIKAGGSAPIIRANTSVEDTTAILRERRTAIVAAGGFGAPAEVDYSMPSLGESHATPLRDAFGEVRTERGQITFIRNLGLADLAASASIWDEQDDIDALAADGPRKPVLVAPLPNDVTVSTEAFVSYVEHGNLAARSFPEHYERVIDLAALAHTVNVERRLLQSLDQLSVAVTVAAGAGALGASRQVLPNLGIAAAGVRSRARLAPNTVLQVILPATFRDIVRADLFRQQPGDRAFAMTDAEVDALFAPFNLVPVYSLDHQVAPAQSANAALVAIEDDLVAYLVVPGSATIISGGVLDLGIVRDSDLIARNSFQTFSEEFLALAVTGFAPVKLTIAGSVPSGVSRAAA